MKTTILISALALAMFSGCSKDDLVVPTSSQDIDVVAVSTTMNSKNNDQLQKPLMYQGQPIAVNDSKNIVGGSATTVSKGQTQNISNSVMAGNVKASNEQFSKDGGSAVVQMSATVSSKNLDDNKGRTVEDIRLKSPNQNNYLRKFRARTPESESAPKPLSIIVQDTP